MGIQDNEIRHNRTASCTCEKTANNTCIYVFIAMLSYIIERHLREKWKDINVTVEEGIHELSSINCITVHVRAVKYSQIPEPREIGSRLISALSVTLPKAIPCSDIKISTRKKLELKRKK